ncbi:MAG: response regulator transcription factor, partial [Ferruginibacter sp.]
MIRVAIVEDNVSYLKAMQVLISSQPDLLLVYTAENLSSLVSLYSSEPDVIILDIDLPIRNGIEGVKLIKEELPQAGVFMLTVFEDEDKIFNSIKAGALGYLLKKDPPEKIIEAIHAINNG